MHKKVDTKIRLFSNIRGGKSVKAEKEQYQVF